MRWLIRAAVAARARYLHAVARRRVAGYRRAQQALFRRYGVEGHDPTPYGEATRARILTLAGQLREPHEFVWTSGTVDQPKQLLYPRSRARTLQWTYLKQVLLASDAVELDRLSGYFLTGLTPDRSLSALLARHRPPWLLRAIALRGSLGHLPQAAAFAAGHSHEAVHLLLLGLAAPAIVATVNPATLAALLERASRDWDRIREEVRALARSELPEHVRRRLGRRVEVRLARLLALAGRSPAPTPTELLPGVQVVYCWDGGYVGPFVDRLRALLGPAGVRIFPMFSLSTETVAYEIYPRISTDGGLPIHPGVCYEFLPVGAAPVAANLLRPWELLSGRRYEMVVSDAYGLRRYRTEDAFECLARVRETPLLRFVGRVGLTYSFTGEKLSAEQLLAVYEQIRADLGAPGAVFTCFPTLAGEGLPGYVFVCCAADAPAGLSAEEIDMRLMRINHEYAAKRRSGRLAAPALIVADYAALAGALMRSDPRYAAAGPQQFKLLPLHQTFWEDLSSDGRLLS